LIQHLRLLTERSPGDVSVLGKRSVAGRNCLGIVFRYLAGANGTRALDEIWFAEGAGYWPMLWRYEYQTGTAVRRTLELRQVDRAVWFPTLTGTATSTLNGQRIALRLVQVTQLEWGYRASRDALALDLRDRDLSVFSDARGGPIVFRNLGVVRADELDRIYEAVANPVLSRSGRLFSTHSSTLWIILGLALLMAVAGLVARRLFSSPWTSPS